MFNRLRYYFYRWRGSKNIKHDLDVLIERANPASPLQERLLWLVDLLQWIRFQSVTVDPTELFDVRKPSARVKFFLMVLERNPAWKANVAQTLQSIIRDVRSVEFFTEIGLPKDLGLWSEFWDRVTSKVLPEPVLSDSMSNLFSAVFARKEDSDWLITLDLATVERIFALFYYGNTDGKPFYEKLTRDIEGAMVLLSTQIQALGYSAPIRKRSHGAGVLDLPFLRLSHVVDDFLHFYHQDDISALRKCHGDLQKTLRECEEVFHTAYKHLDLYGVSVAVVYSVESAQAKIRRMELLSSFLLKDQVDTPAILLFLVQLIEENQSRLSLRGLFTQNMRLLARKIVDRSAEKGVHYITRTKEEYREMFKKAAGGGAVMSITVYVKFAIGWLKLPQFFEGFFFGVNYASSFVAIHLLGFTVATKQPGMTGPALAAKIQHANTEEGLKNLVDEIVYLIRSQIVGILGNAGIIAPIVIVSDLLSYYSANAHLIGRDKAEYIVDSLNILGPTPIFAAFTGVLLWASSVFAGWMENWFVLNQMGTTITYNRRLNYVFGKDNCAWAAKFSERNISGFAANISLGFLLGMTPTIFAFFGIGMEVRHVTLSSGQLAAGVAVLGFSILQTWGFWLAIIGVASVGFLNVLVSFSLALFVAVQARGVEGPRRREIYRAVWTRFKAKPMSFFRP